MDVTITSSGSSKNSSSNFPRSDVGYSVIATTSSSNSSSISITMSFSY